jgi:hypothetical protein
LASGLDLKEPNLMRYRRVLIVSAFVVVVAFSLLAAGCGSGGGSPGVASVASSTTAATTTTQIGLVAYAGCMRTHGMPNFPDPDGQGTFPSLQALGVSKPTWARGDIACKHLLPNGDSGPPQETARQQRTRLAAGLSFASACAAMV